MRGGKLSNRDISTIMRAQEILNAWIDHNESNGVGPDEDEAVNSACVAAVGIADFMVSYDEKQHD